MTQAASSRRQLRMRLALASSVLSLPALALMLFAIWTMIPMGARELRVFAVISAGYGIAAAVLSSWRRSRLQKQIERHLDADDVSALSSDERRAALSAVIALPRWLHGNLLAVWCGAGVALPIGMTLLGQPGWGFFRGGVLLLVCTTGGLISSALMYFVSKRWLAGVRESIARDASDSGERVGLAKPLPLSRKVQYAVAGSAVASLIFTMALAYTHAGASIEDGASQWQRRAIAQIAPLAEERGLDRALAALLPEPKLLPYPAAFAIYAPGTQEARAIQASARFESNRVGRNTSRLYAWSVLSDGRLIVSAIPRSELWRPLASLRMMLSGVLVVVIGLSLFIAYLLADDISGAVRALRAEAERIASGDLRPGQAVESDDELGDLSRAFGRMAVALRKTVGRVAEAADRVDTAAAEFANVSEGVGAASADQGQRIRQTSELMVQINSRVSEVAQSAQDLNISVEESSSSILELGAAGDELNDTASVLSAKVEEVSGSIEQMVRSVKQVGSSSDGLAEAAAETSSSMEEMASAMRAVDTTAEKTADLSRDVVHSAEKGQSKVAQTMEGMQAIREATDVAERVIRGLGARADEIGAILDVIDDVADETSLLALNAAIIAAQAGEHGRAFSVVADEIKELADRVLASTKEIGSLIRAVQDESGNAVGAVEAGSQRVASGVDLSAEAGTSLEEITTASRESGERIGQIVSAVREQTKAAAHVVALMDRVRDGVEQISAAGAEQDRGNEVVYRSAVTMREVAQQVRRTTEEQSRGFGRIRESIEGVHQSVEKINGSLQEQSSACGRVADFLGELSQGTRSNEEAARSMSESMRALVQEAEALREDVAKFQI